MTEEIKRESNKLTQEFLSAFKDIETFIVDLARTKTHDDYITFS
jgi:DNA-binding ferritin-like protein (Dps family)